MPIPSIPDTGSRARDKQSAIIWPLEYQPGTVDNFVTNEIIASSISAPQIWAQLADISKWTSYYHNVSSITPPPSGPILKKGEQFKFSTFGFPVLTCDVVEAVEPSKGQAGRLAWKSTLGQEGEDDWVSVYHAWLVEDLEGERVRVLTQEAQKGKPAKELSEVRPNKMLLGHQDWLDGLVKAVRGEKVVKEETNLAKVGMLAY